MKRNVISFGKFDFNGCGRRINEITVEIELRENRDGKPVLSVCGDVWNSKHTDIIRGGQCLDALNEKLKHNRLFAEIYDLWQKYHLNDMNAGTPEQLAFLEEHKDEINEADGFYHKELNLLKKYGMEKDSEGVVYGTKSYYREIPDADLERINKVLAVRA